MKPVLKSPEIKKVSFSVNLLKITRKIIFAIILCIFFLFTCVMITPLMYSFYSDIGLKVKVFSEIPEGFPVLVLTPQSMFQKYDSQIVYYKALPGFLEKHPSYTYLVPKGEEKDIKLSISKSCRSNMIPRNYNRESPNLWAASFTVKRISEKKQSFEVYCTLNGDYDNRGWYEATEKQIFPKYYKHVFGPGAMMSIFPFAFLINIILGLIAYKFYRKIPNRGDAS